MAARSALPAAPEFKMTEEQLTALFRLDKLTKINMETRENRKRIFRENIHSQTMHDHLMGFIKELDESKKPIYKEPSRLVAEILMQPIYPREVIIANIQAVLDRYEESEDKRGISRINAVLQGLKIPSNTLYGLITFFFRDNTVPKIRREEIFACFGPDIARNLPRLDEDVTQNVGIIVVIPVVLEKMGVTLAGYKPSSAYSPAAPTSTYAVAREVETVKRLGQLAVQYFVQFAKGSSSEINQAISQIQIMIQLCYELLNPDSHNIIENIFKLRAAGKFLHEKYPNLYDKDPNNSFSQFLDFASELCVKRLEYSGLVGAISDRLDEEKKQNELLSKERQYLFSVLRSATLGEDLDPKDLREFMSAATAVYHGKEDMPESKLKDQLKEMRLIKKDEVRDIINRMKKIRDYFIEHKLDKRKPFSYAHYDILEKILESSSFRNLLTIGNSAEDQEKKPVLLYEFYKFILNIYKDKIDKMEAKGLFDRSKKDKTNEFEKYIKNELNNTEEASDHILFRELARIIKIYCADSNFYTKQFQMVRLGEVGSVPAPAPKKGPAR